MKKPEVKIVEIDPTKDSFFCRWDMVSTISDVAKSRCADYPELNYDQEVMEMQDDSMFNQDTWLECLENISELMAGRTKWKGYAKGFGWRKINGYLAFTADSAEKFLSAILPKTDNTFYIYLKDDVIAINNFHHDSPTGEWYYIEPDID